MKLPLSYFHNDDVVFLAKDLLGKILFTNIDNQITAGIITETEAYCQSEKGCHAYNGKRTRRTEIMFQQGGYAYIYLCYGMHYLFNIVTGKKDVAKAVLIRAIYPTIGISVMLERRHQTKLNKNICKGPAKVAQALGLTKSQNETLLQEQTIWLQENDYPLSDGLITTSKRIGIDYAGADADLLWRFNLEYHTL